MNYDYYKAACEATDADERALIPGFKRTRPQSQEERTFDGEDAEEWQRRADRENTYEENRN